MNIDSTVVKKIAKLARIKLQESEITELSSDLNKIFGWIDQLNEVNTDGVEPLRSVVAKELEMRKDVVDVQENREMVLQNAPNSKYGFFATPKVVE